MATINVNCEEKEDGWLCEVTVDPHVDPSRHTVTLSSEGNF